MTANYTTRNSQHYINVRLVRDAKFFPKKGDIPAATYVTFAHTSKGQDVTIYVDARIIRGAELASNMRKGDIVNAVVGEMTFKVDNEGNIRGVIYDASYETTVKLKDRPAVELTEETAAATDQSDGAPAFD